MLNNLSPAAKTVVVVVGVVVALNVAQNVAYRTAKYLNRKALENAAK